MDLVMGIPFWQDCCPGFQKQVALRIRVRVYLPDDFIARRAEVDNEFYVISRGSCELEMGPDSVERPVSAMKSASETLEPAKKSSLFSRMSSQRDTIGSTTDSSKPSGRRGQQRSGGNLAQMLDKAKAQDASLPRDVGDKTVKTLTRGQGFGEMALLMNYPRTVNVRATTYAEVCVLSRRDFRQILTQHPEARDKVVPVMLSACMVGNEANGVHCLLLEMVKSVYNANTSLDQKGSLSAKKAASIISDAICLNLDGKSILCGIDASLKHELAKKRDRNLECTRCNHAPRACGTDHSKHHEPATALTEKGALVPSIAALEARITQLEASQQALKARLMRIESSQDAMTKDMRNAIGNLTRAVAHAHAEFRHFIAPTQPSGTKRLPPLELGKRSPRDGVLRGFRTLRWPLRLLRVRSQPPERIAEECSCEGEGAVSGHPPPLPGASPAQAQTQPHLEQPPSRLRSKERSVPRRLSQPDIRRPRLLKRVSEFVGLTSEPPAATSPTQFADFLFRRSSPTDSDSS